MNPLLPRPTDTVLTERPRTHWIDTNVQLEVYSHGDLYMDWGLAHCSEPPWLNRAVTPERRRARMQGALWMAMALARSNAVTLTYQHENLANIIRIAPPDSEIGDWTSDVLYVLGDGGLFDGWDRIATTSGETLSNRDRDRLIVRACANTPVSDAPGTTTERQAAMTAALAEIRAHTTGPLVLVTRDVQLTREARAAGVDAYTPEAVAARTLSWADARAMFEHRLERAIDRRVAQGPLAQWRVRKAGMDRLRQVYASIWSPETEPWFPPAT